jgi:hypothetical protein
MAGMIASLMLAMGASLIAVPLYRKLRALRNLHTLRDAPRYVIYTCALEQQRQEVIRTLEHQVSAWPRWQIVSFLGGAVLIAAGAIALTL